MTNNEAHTTDYNHTAARAAILDRARMRPSVRRQLEAAEAAGDWATVAAITGENVGTN